MYTLLIGSITEYLKEADAGNTSAAFDAENSDDATNATPEHLNDDDAEPKTVAYVPFDLTRC